jgi:hypothetical protein
MNHEDKGTKVSRKRVTVIATALAAALLGLSMTAAPGLAAPATTVQVTSHSLAADVSGAGVITGKVLPAVPDISQLPCNNRTSFHLYGTYGEVCFGYTGTQFFRTNKTFKACAGNNYGTLRFYDPHTGLNEHWDFAPGHIIAWSYGVNVNSLTITGYSGRDAC